MNKLPDYLTRKFLEWQTQMGARKTLEEFADYLDISRPLLSFWINGKRVPNDENIEKISLRFGNEIYDVLEKDRPNPYLQKLNRAWEFIPEEIQKKFSEEAEKYETQNISERTEKVHKRKKARKTE